MQQHSRERRRLLRVSRCPTLTTNHPCRVYRSFYARDLKKTIYSEICRLYISLWSIQARNDIVPTATFSPLANARTSLPPFVPFGSHIYAENIYFYYNHHPCSWVNRFLVTALVRIDPDALASLTLPGINKSAKFELFPSFSSVISRLSCRWDIYPCKFYE